MAHFEKDFDKKMKRLGYSLTYYNDKSDEPLDVENIETTNIYVGLHVLNGSISDLNNTRKAFETEGIYKTFKVPKKKLITPEYLINKINKDNIFINFAEDFKKLLNKAGYHNGISVYPTSYGIGVFVILTHGLESIKNEIKSILNKYDIEYLNEYSEARWVFRYKISKKANNIKKIKNIIY